MGKSRRVLLALMAIGLAASFYACSDKGSSDSSQDGGVSGSGSSLDGSDITSSPDNSSVPGGETADPVDVGAFADQKWIGADAVLDFAAGTLTGSEIFKVTGISGENADSVISCTADGTDYIFALNADGILEMFSAAAEEGSAPLKTFMADAAAFGGAWMTDDPYAAVYYVVDSAPNAAGCLEWDQLSLYTNESAEAEGTAVTRFAFDETGEASVSLVMSSWGYPHAVVSYDENGALVIADDWDEYAFLPCAKPFGDSASYLTENGDKILLDGEAGTVTYNGTTAEYEAAATGYGSGLKFTAEGKDYLIQRRLGGFYAVSSDGAAVLAAYAPDRIKGDWSSSSGAFTLSVENDGKVTFNKAEYDLKAYAREGEVLYDFTVNSRLYTIRPIEGVDAAFLLETEVAVHAGYYVLDKAKDSYVNTYTNNIQQITIDENYFITATSLLDESAEPETFQGSFTYLPDLECIALVYSGMGTSAMYMVNVDEGVYWILSGGDYTVYASYFVSDLIPQLQEMFSAGLDGADDVYTTGGVDPQTLSFDFVKGEIVYNGEATVFYWDYEVDYISAYPVMVFITDVRLNEEGEMENCVYHSVRPFDLGVSMTAVDTETLEESYFYYISDAVFRDMLGLSYTYRGPLYDETFVLDRDGSFSMATTDLTESNAAVSLVKYEYFLQRFVNPETGKDTTIIAFRGAGDLYLYTYIVAGEYATLFDITYSRNEVLDFIGTYYSGADTLELTREAGIKINGTAAEMKEAPTVANGAAVAVYESEGKSYTVTFSADGSATVSEADSGDRTYTKKTLTPAAFVGAYKLGEDTEIVVTSSALGINNELTLSVSLNGSSVTASLGFTADGRQQLSFSVLDFSDFPFTETKYTITLDGDNLILSDGVSTATAAAADWDYSKFLFTDTVTLTDASGNTHTLVCLPKQDGKAPLFLYDGNACSSYQVSIAADGTLTLEVTYLFDTFRIEVTADGVTAGYKPSDIPDIPDIPLPPPLP